MHYGEGRDVAYLQDPQGISKSCSRITVSSAFIIPHHQPAAPAPLRARKGGYVVMSNGKEFEVSARRKEEFIASLGM